MFIQTETTPNPATLKFLPGRSVLDVGTRDYRDAAEAEIESPLAFRLFAVEGVSGVFLAHNFISVTKTENSEWQHLRPAVLGAIMEHFMSDVPVLNDAQSGQGDAGGEGSHDYAEEDADTVATIRELLDTRVRPAVAQDGGDIVFHAYRDGIVYLHMRGACAGCPSATATLQQGIENLLRHFVPEVQGVRPVA
jgi:Fe-S cluster biogenesis protein NfuA